MKSSGSIESFARSLFAKFPAAKQFLVGVKVSCVIDPLVLAERHVEFAVTIEAAQTVETSPIQKIEKLGRLLRASRTVRDELVEARALRVEKLLVVARINLQ